MKPVRCPGCMGKGCSDCGEFGWVWDDGVPPELCLDGKIPCGRADDTCPGCGRLVEHGKPMIEDSP